MEHTWENYNYELHQKKTRTSGKNYFSLAQWNTERSAGKHVNSMNSMVRFDSMPNEMAAVTEARDYINKC